MEDDNPKEMQSTNKILWITGVTLIIVLALFILSVILEFLLIAFAGILLAVFWGGLAETVHSKTRIPYGLALFLVILLLFLLLAGSQFLEGPRFIGQITQLVDRLPEGIERIQSFLDENEWVQQFFPRQQTFPLGRDIIGSITGVFSNMFTLLGIVLIVLFIGIYLAVNPKMYIHGIVALFPPEKRPRLHELFRALGHALRWWLFGRFCSMFVVGFLTAIGLMLIGMPLAFALGLIAALLSFIPYMGPILSIMPAILLALVESPMMVVYVIIIYIIVQALESYLITPLIQEKAVSMPPALLIVIQILMGFLAGILGILLATPVMVVIIVLIQILYVRNFLGESVKLLGEH